MTTVLVLDDEANLVELVQSYLEREGFAVTTACDGPAAVEGVRRLHPDLIVLDLMLPGFDGIEVCRRVRQFSDAYILMLTARGEEIDRIVGLAVGADDYLVKPFSPRELVARAGPCCGVREAPAPPRTTRLRHFTWVSSPSTRRAMKSNYAESWCR